MSRDNTGTCDHADIGPQRRRVRRRFGPAEAVADALREQILSGEVGEGDLIPKLEDLVSEFGVSKPAAREACRILQTEGLVSVVRGNVGGAIVHRPTPATAAYTVGLVLESRAVAMPDVAAAIERFEPLCAEWCAEREDRLTAVLPALETCQVDLVAAAEFGDGEAAARAARRWHESLVANCGNESAAVVLGTLVEIFTAHVEMEASQFRARGVSLSDELTRRTIAEHAHIAELIAAGDAGAAAAAARAHLRTARIHPDDGGAYDSVVRAHTVRDRTSG